MVFSAAILAGSDGHLHTGVIIIMLVGEVFLFVLPGFYSGGSALAYYARIVLS